MDLDKRTKAPLASLSLTSGTRVSTSGRQQNGRKARETAVPLGAKPRPLPKTVTARSSHTGPPAPAAPPSSSKEGTSFRPWHIPLGAGMFLFQVARAAASHLKPAGPGSPPTFHPTGDVRVFPSLLPSRVASGGGGGPGVPGGRKPALVWFRNDLRLHDHEPLTTASQEATSLVPVYCFDPREYGKSPSGFDKTGPYRARFILEALQDLKARLKDMGSDLLVRLGKPEEVLPKLAKATGAGSVYCYGQVTREEQKVERAVAAALDRQGAQLLCSWGGTLFHQEDLPFKLEDMPPNYGDFRKRVAHLSHRPPLPSPSSLKSWPAGGALDPGTLPSLSELGFSAATLSRCQADKAALGAGLYGGETEALRQLEAYARACSSKGAAGTAAAKGAPASEAGEAAAQGGEGSGSFSCKISPWLAMGCLSPREMYQQLLQDAHGAGGAQAGGPKAKDISWLLFELLWRDFFRFITKKYAMVQELAVGAPALVPC